MEKNFSSIFKYLFLILIVFLVFLPLFIIIAASFKTIVEIGSTSPISLPSTINLENYKTVLQFGGLIKGFSNSSILVIVSLIFNILIGTTTAYAINRFNFKLKPVIMGLFLVGMLVPQLISEIARFQVISAMKLYNTLWAPIIIYSTTDLVQLFIYIQFLEKIPTAVDESAMIDGCNYFQVFFKIILPLLLPAMATVAIIKAVDIINDMYIPKIYLSSPDLATMTTTLLKFSNGKFSAWNTLSAAIVIVMLPTILLYIVFQRFVFDGIVAGTVKE